MAGSRFGLVGVDAGLVRRLGAMAESSMQVERCQDPVRFAGDSVADQCHQRVLGVSLDVEDVWGVLEALRQWGASCPVVVFHGGGEIGGQLRAIASGVAAVVFREAAPLRILRAAEAVLDGDGVIALTTLSSFASVLPAVEDVSESLSAEERRWLAWLADGITIQALAHRTVVSERQMRRRLSALYLRMGVVNRDQAVALASRIGIID